MLLQRPRHPIALLVLFAATASVSSCSSPPQVASVETAAGLRIEVRAVSASPLGKAEFDLSAVFEAADGRTLGPIEIGLDWGGYRRTNLYRTPDGCLVLTTSVYEIRIVEETLVEAARNECSSFVTLFSDDCPDPAFDPATRTARPLSDARGYLGTFEFNMGPPVGERLWLWQFHHAGDEAECTKDPGG